ncbi:MAG: glycosyltransferase family 4 protein [Actinobacteria bacterium]|nr:glycosyltransferase family 4 protein [Actinomycetota bacterium]
MKTIDLSLGRFKIPIASVGTYPPRQCGIATFTYDLCTAINLRNNSKDSYIVAINNEDGYKYSDEVKFTIDQNDCKSYIEAAIFVNSSDAEAVNIQHEYGIYGGSEGEYLLSFLVHLEKPSVLTLHTTIPEPTYRLKEITQLICKYAHAVVGLTEKSIEILENVYKIDPAKLNLIYHGVPDVERLSTDLFKKEYGLAGRKVLSTFGLINRGKGIEYVLDALPSVIRKQPDVVYLVLGQTHPVVRKNEGEAYREFLEKKVDDLGIRNNVIFVNKYLEFKDLVNYLMATDLYVTPNLSKDQIVSGTLAYAVGCGKAIISTPYLYAQELLAGDRGVLVDFRDSVGLSDSINKILGDPVYKEKLEFAAYKYGRQMTWPNISRDYLRLFSRVLEKEKVKDSVFTTSKIISEEELSKGGISIV